MRITLMKQVLETVTLAIAFPKLHLLGIERRYSSMTKAVTLPGGSMKFKFGRGWHAIWVAVEKDSPLLEGPPPYVVDILHDMFSTLHRVHLVPGSKLSYTDVDEAYDSALDYRTNIDAGNSAFGQLNKFLDGRSTNKPGV